MLYLVATPIGNLADITLRALETLKSVDIIVCEDTRVSSKLLKHYGISKPLKSYHDHNGDSMRPKLLSYLKEGKKLAYITDGGMPLISDPGYKLVVACQNERLPFTVIPGPSAPLMALCLSGLPTDQFIFCGFLPPKHTARQDALQKLKLHPSTLIFFESPRRLVSSLKDCLFVLGDRQGAICRELTKLYEDVQRGLLSQLIEEYETHPPRGEIVIVIQGAQQAARLDEKELEIELKKALSIYSMKEAVDLVARTFGYPKREVYQYALSLKSKEEGLS